MNSYIYAMAISGFSFVGEIIVLAVALSPIWVFPIVVGYCGIKNTIARKIAIAEIENQIAMEKEWRAMVNNPA
jgi:hypothetical protein